MSSQGKYKLPRFGVVVFLIAICGFVIGFASHYVISKFSPRVHSIGTEDRVTPSQLTSQVENESSRFAVGSLQDLSNSTQFNSLFERTGALLDLLAPADENTLQEYLVESKTLFSHHFRRQVQNVIIQRLSAIAPRSVLTVVRDEFSDEKQLRFLNTIFEEWSVVNLPEAITQAQSLDKKSREMVVASMVLSRDDLTLAERRDIARQSNCEWVAINMLSKASESSIFIDPEHDWYEFVNSNRLQFSNLSEPQTQALGHILRAWIEREGLQILDVVRSTVPSGFSMLDTITFVTDQVVDTKPKFALDLALEMTAKDEQDHRFRYLARYLAGRWAESNPRRALDATLSVDGRSLRGMLQGSVVRQWAKQDPHALLNIVDTLPADLQIIVRQHALIAIAATSPESAVERLSDFSIRKNRDAVAKAIARSWVKTDVSKIFDWIETDSNIAHIQSELTRVAFVHLTHLDPALAVQEAAVRPVDDNGEGWEATVISRLVIKGDVDAAVALLSQVRAGATRVRAYGDVIEHLLEEQYDTNLAADLFLQLNENEITRVSYFVDDLTRLAPRRIYKDLDKIEPKRIRLYIASSLISNNLRNGTFTSEELESLEEMTQRDD